MSDNGAGGYDGATAVGQNDNHITTSSLHASHSNGAKGKGRFGKGSMEPADDGPTGATSRSAYLSTHFESAAAASSAQDLPFVDSDAYLSVRRPFCVPTAGKKGGVRQALEELNDELIQAGMTPLISGKKPHKIIGREVNPGSFGLYEYGSQPQLLLEPGNYPGLPFSNWIGCTWKGVFNLSDNFPPLEESSTNRRLLQPNERLSKFGLSIIQVSQNQAAVCMDPQNRVFVVADGGFVAVAQTGAYRTLGLVDMTHLADTVRDKYTNQILGHTQTVRLPAGYVAATFLDIPANNVAILQRKDELFQLAAGQHYLTTASVTIRGLFTRGEVQQELECDNIYTRDQVPVWLRMYLRYELRNPLELAKHGYETPFDSLQDKTRSILTQILAHLDYSAMARSRNAAPDTIGDHHAENSHHEDDVNSVFVSAVRSQATDELKLVASEYGILLHDLAIIDRKFKGDIARKMDELTTRALEAQVESANLDRENQNRRRKQEGDARVLELQNSMKRATAETDASNVIAAARAQAEAVTIAAQAEATAIRMRAEADAEAVRIKARADADIPNEFAQGQARGRIEVERTRAFGDRTVFAPSEALSAGGIVGAASLGLLGGQAGDATGQRRR